MYIHTNIICGILHGSYIMAGNIIHQYAWAINTCNHTLSSLSLNPISLDYVKSEYAKININTVNRLMYWLLSWQSLRTLFTPGG